MADQFDPHSGDGQHPNHPGNPEEFGDESSQPLPEDHSSQPLRRRFSAWMVLVPVLLIVIGLYASDILFGQNPQKKAFEQIQDILPRQQTAELQIPGANSGGRRQDQDSEPASKIISADAVHKLIGRQPDSTQKGTERINDEMQPVLVETYRFPGIIESYNVVVTYLLDDSVKDDPMTALKYVRKQYQPRIGTMKAQ
jgi:hypothetical protein